MHEKNSKKTYYTVSLRKYGSVSDLTKANSGMPGDPMGDGGTFPNFYTS